MVDKLIVADISPVRTSPNLYVMPSILETLNKIVLPINVPISTARITADQQLLKIINDKGLRAFLLTNLVQKNDGRYTFDLAIGTTKNFNTLQFHLENEFTCTNGKL